MADFSNDIEYLSRVLQNFVGDLSGAMQSQPYWMTLNPKLFIDGTNWCALYGENLMEGIAGFGPTPSAALADFEMQMHRPSKENANGNA
jgi:hypothetical protein